MAVELASNQVAQHGLAKIDGPVRRRAADVLQMHSEKLWIALDEHGNGTGALSRLARAASSVLRNVGADDDGAAVLGLEG